MHATFVTLWLHVVQPLANVHETKWTPHVKRETDVAQLYTSSAYGAFECGRIYRVYEFRPLIYKIKLDSGSRGFLADNVPPSLCSTSACALHRRSAITQAHVHCPIALPRKRDVYTCINNTPLHSSEVRMLTRGHGLTYLGQLE